MAEVTSVRPRRSLATRYPPSKCVVKCKGRRGQRERGGEEGREGGRDGGRERGREGGEEGGREGGKEGGGGGGGREEEREGGGGGGNTVKNAEYKMFIFIHYKYIYRDILVVEADEANQIFTKFL